MNGCSSSTFTRFPLNSAQGPYDAVSYREESSMDTASCPIISSEVIKQLKEKKSHIISANMAVNGKIPAEVGPFAEENKALLAQQDRLVMVLEPEALVAAMRMSTRRHTISSDMIVGGKIPQQVGPFAHINLNPTTIWSKGSRTLD